MSQLFFRLLENLKTLFFYNLHLPKYLSNFLIYTIYKFNL